jgi:hypothetical protein
VEPSFQAVSSSMLAVSIRTWTAPLRLERFH